MESKQHINKIRKLWISSWLLSISLIAVSVAILNFFVLSEFSQISFWWIPGIFIPILTGLILRSGILHLSLKEVARILNKSYPQLEESSDLFLKTENSLNILETLQPGETWAQLGFFKCITTSETQKDYITKLMRNVSVDVLEPFISDVYSKPSLPAKPIVSVLTRDQRDTINLVKSFYIKFPQYRWITFRDMRNLTEKQFADGLKDVCLSVWVDEISSYGTFPLESMKTGVPVLGLVPNIVPSWLNENNGLWANNKVQIVDFVADYLQSWLEDNIDSKIYDEMENTVSSLSTKEKFDTEAVSLIEGYINTRLSSFEEQLSKLETIEE